MSAWTPGAQRRPRPSLLLTLASPPPIKLTGNGFHEVDASVAVGLDSLCERAGMTHEEYERLRTAIPACVAWITWEEIHAVVMRQKGSLVGSPFEHRGIRPSDGWGLGPSHPVALKWCRYRSC